ncbi:MAG: hypothetical protein ACREOU_09970 [Candidatus Eiseniibacteriota bacterium]
MSPRAGWILLVVVVLVLLGGAWWMFRPRALAPPQTVWERRSESKAKIVGPTLATSPNGKWFALAWAEGRRVWWMRGTSTGGQMRLDAPSALPDSLHPFTAFDEDPPKAAVDNEGQLAIAWMTRPLSRNEGSVIAVARPNLDRDRRVSLTRIESDNPKSFLLSESIHYDDDGRLLAVWIDAGSAADSDGEQGVLQCAVASPQGAFEGIASLSDSVCACCNTSLSWLGPDRFALAWRGVAAGDVRDIRFAVLEERGEGRGTPPALTPESRTVVHADGWSIQGCPLAGPSVGAIGESAAWVTWYTEGPSRGLYLARLAPGTGGGSAASVWRPAAPLAVEAGAQGAHPKMATLSSGRPLVVYEQAVGEQGRMVQARVQQGQGLTAPYAFSVATRASRPTAVRFGINSALLAWSESDDLGPRLVLADWRDL